MNIVRLSSELKEEMYSLSKYTNQDIYMKPEQYRIAILWLVEKFFEEFDYIKQLVEHHGYLVIDNLPIDDNIPSTPSTIAEIILKNKYIQELNLITLGYMFGNIYSFKQENINKIHNIFPSKQHISERSSLGSKYSLGFHTEIAFSEARPDYIMLNCARSSQKLTPTIICNMADSIQQLSNDSLESLIHDDFFVRQPYLFGDEVLFRKMHLIQKKENGQYIFIFDLEDGITISTTSTGEKALLEIAKYCENNKRPIVLEDGQILILDNTKILHGRNSIEANFDGKDRWLQRIYIKCHNLR